jgi:hypothetical protein
MTQLLEHSLSRVWQHNQDPDKVFAILTAFRGEYDYEENVRRNKALAADVRAMGYGFFYLDGHWIENEGTENQRLVNEDSLFVATKNKQGFAKNILKLVRQYDQEAAVINDDKSAQLLFQDGSTAPLGELQPGKIGTIYSKLRGKPDQTFIFENERDDLSWIQRLAGLQKL